MKSKVGITGIVLLAVFGAGVLFLMSGDTSPSVTDKSGNASMEQDQRRIPSLVFQDYEGNAVDLADFVGKPMVVNSWAKWCLFCVDELPDFAALQDEFGDEVVFIAIDRAEPLSVAKTFTDSLGITSKMIFLLDPEDIFHGSIGGIAMPETIFVDEEGNIQFHKRGVMRIDEIRKRTLELL